MRKICTIAWRDFKSTVTSPIFFVVAGVCSVLWSITYLRALFTFAQRLQYSQMQGQPASMNINYDLFIQHISYVHLALLFITPAITMRLLAEEKKMRTYDLLLTSPISATDIAVGKFLGGYASVLTLVAISFLYPLGTAALTGFNWPTLIAAYGGLCMVSALYVGVGVFASSLTESIFLSLVLGVLFNLTLWFIGAAQDTADSSLWGAVMEHITIGQQFFQFLKGTFRISSATFFLSAAAFFVFLSQRVVESSRWR